jgi:hypothetical protein
MKPRMFAVLFIALLLLLASRWARTAKPVEQHFSVQNPGIEPTGAPDAPLCPPDPTPGCDPFPFERRI